MTALVQQRDCCCSRSSLSDAVCAQDALGGLIYIRWWNDLTHSRRHERHAQQLQNANSLERRSCTKKRSTALANYFRKACFCHGSVTWLSLRCVCVSWTTSGPWRHWDCSAVTKQHGWEAETSSRARAVTESYVVLKNSSLQHNASWISPTSASEVLRVTRSSACVTGLNGHVQVHTVVSPVQNPDRTQLSVLALSSEHGGLEGKTLQLYSMSNADNAYSGGGWDRTYIHANRGWALYSGSEDDGDLPFVAIYQCKKRSTTECQQPVREESISGRASQTLLYLRVYSRNGVRSIEYKLGLLSANSEQSAKVHLQPLPWDIYICDNYVYQFVISSFKTAYSCLY